MLGVNAFVDHDLTRAHNRGGIGVELQYDWLRLSSNFYAPLSDWRDSHDFDPRRREERPAKGRDVRIEAALPFYRPVTLTGGYTQWKGDEVGVFGHRKLEKDPRVWFYGLEYTPAPPFTVFVTQQRTERGQTEARFGLSFTYPFDLPLGKQLKPSKGTVSGDRYDFADRENRIILADRTKNLDGTATKTAASVVTDLDLAQYITSPRVGETPQTTITGSQYIGTIKWSPDDSSFNHKTYTATVILTPLSGWTFDGVKVDTFVYSGSTKISNNANSGNNIEIIWFIEEPTEEPT
jgi:hypothetical protein